MGSSYWDTYFVLFKQPVPISHSHPLPLRSSVTAAVLQWKVRSVVPHQEAASLVPNHFKKNGYGAEHLNGFSPVMWFSKAINSWPAHQNKCAFVRFLHAVLIGRRLTENTRNGVELTFIWLNAQVSTFSTRCGLAGLVTDLCIPMGTTLSQRAHAAGKT